MGYLPRNLHFEVRKVLCLLRNMRFEVHRKVLYLHFEVPCCAGHEICTSRFTKCCSCQEICTSRATECCACHEACKRATCPKSRFTAPVTKSELLDDHHHVQGAAPATKTALRSQTPPIPCACHEKSTLRHQNTRFPLRLPRKVITMCENADGTTTRAQLLEAPAADTQILRACAVEMHIDMNVL